MPTEIPIIGSMSEGEKEEARLYNMTIRAQQRYVWAASFGSEESRKQALRIYNNLIDRLGFDPFE